MKHPYRLLPLSETPDYSGFFYRLPNARMQLTLRADGRVSVMMRRLLSKEEAGALRSTPAAPFQTLTGRVLETWMVLSQDAVSAFTHFGSHIQVQGPQVTNRAFPVRPRPANAPK